METSRHGGRHEKVRKTRKRTRDSGTLPITQPPETADEPIDGVVSADVGWGSYRFKVIGLRSASAVYALAMILVVVVLWIPNPEWLKLTGIGAVVLLALLAARGADERGDGA